MEYRGAEAKVTLEDESAVKKRERKKYRHEDLDRKLRSERTSEELKNTRRARKYGANTPEISEKNQDTLEMERIGGEPVKKIIETDHAIAEKIGENIGRMHSGDVIHGDLTTSNILWTGREAYIIDFGLSTVSEREEDKAVDIHLFKQVLESSHPEVAKDAWEKFLEGYNTYSESEKILEQLEDVESRGRYK